MDPRHILDEYTLSTLRPTEMTYDVWRDSDDRTYVTMSVSRDTTRDLHKWVARTGRTPQGIDGAAVPGNALALYVSEDGRPPGDWALLEEQYEGREGDLLTWDTTEQRFFFMHPHERKNYTWVGEIKDW